MKFCKTVWGQRVHLCEAALPFKLWTSTNENSQFWFWSYRVQFTGGHFYIKEQISPLGSAVLFMPICRSSYSKSTLADLHRNKALPSGARGYLYIPLYSFSTLGKCLDAPASWQGTACICATKMGYWPPKQGTCLLGMVRRRMKCWNCVYVEGPRINTGLGMHSRTSL